MWQAICASELQHLVWRGQSTEIAKGSWKHIIYHTLVSLYHSHVWLALYFKKLKLLLKETTF